MMLVDYYVNGYIWLLNKYLIIILVFLYLLILMIQCIV